MSRTIGQRPEAVEGLSGPGGWRRAWGAASTQSLQQAYSRLQNPTIVRLYHQGPRSQDLEKILQQKF